MIRHEFWRASAAAVAVAVLLGAWPASAQTRPDTEVFTGYSFALIDIGEDPTGASLAHFNAQGWHVEFTRFLNDRLGIAVDLSGHYASDVSASAGLVAATAPSVKHHGVLVGPRVRTLTYKRLQSSLRVLVGIDRADATGEVTVGGPVGTTTTSLDVDGTALALAFGGGFDLRLSDRVMYRIVQPNYYLTRYGKDGTQSNMRLSTGLVFTF